MCAQCVAQGSAYVGAGLVVLRGAAWRARRRRPDGPERDAEGLLGEADPGDVRGEAEEPRRDAPTVDAGAAPPI